MAWKLHILEKAEKDSVWFRKHQRSLYVKCFDLLREIAMDPRHGTGKPERLKYFTQEVWSRRISHELRLVYVVYADVQEVDIVSCKSHYKGFSLE
jgi:toxin YoeB